LRLPSSAETQILFTDHSEEKGIDFFRKVCEMDLEGIIANRKMSVYGSPPGGSRFGIRSPEGRM